MNERGSYKYNSYMRFASTIKSLGKHYFLPLLLIGLRMIKRVLKYIQLYVCLRSNSE